MSIFTFSQESIKEMIICFDRLQLDISIRKIYNIVGRLYNKVRSIYYPLIHNIGGVILENVMSVAAYIYNRYESEHSCRIDEMKLHKMLYFAQRESFIQSNQPLFEATFYGWKYGPVLKEIRGAYRDGTFSKDIPADVVLRINPVINKVFSDYAEKDSWSLSRLTHGELSWKRSREGIPQTANSDIAMKDEDIIQDAMRVKARREMLGQFGLL